MATYLELKSQIESLQREADELRTKERKEVISRMKEAIAAFEITAADLGFARRAEKARAPAKQKAPSRKARGPSKRSAAAAYSDAQGNTWGGLGKRPNWLRQAIANGAKLEDFAASKK